jgi:glycosyltransferase involved in cell wall biosynthesis
MNIALFASAFYPHVGGVEELCRQLAHEYQARDHGVAVFTERWPRSLAAYEVYEGIPVHRIPFRVMSEGVRAKIKYLATHRAIRRRLLELLGRFRPDVVHVHCVSTNAYYALEVQEATGVPLIVSLHGELTMDAQGLFKRSALARDILRRGLRRADAVTACSRQTLAEAEAFFGEPLGEKGVVVYNGIAEGGGGEIVPFEHPRPYILAIGRHVRQKGFDILLHAMKQLGPAGDPYDLILAGDGVEHEPLKSLATALGLGDRVVFPGQVDHPAAISLFAGCKVFVLPSRNEAFGIVNLEAMVAGKPIVAARVGGVPEIVLDDENGLLVAPENPSELAETLRRLLADEAWQRRLGKAGRERAKLFTWPRIVEEYMAVYAAALSRSRGRQLALSRSL